MPCPSPYIDLIDLMRFGCGRAINPPPRTPLPWGPEQCGPCCDRPYIRPPWYSDVSEEKNTTVTNLLDAESTLPIMSDDFIQHGTPNAVNVIIYIFTEYTSRKR